MAITVDFTVKSGHRHPNLESRISNYRSMLVGMGREEAEIAEKMGKIREKVGLM